MLLYMLLLKMLPALLLEIMFEMLLVLWFDMLLVLMPAPPWLALLLTSVLHHC